MNQWILPLAAIIGGVALAIWSEEPELAGILIGYGVRDGQGKAGAITKAKKEAQ